MLEQVTDALQLANGPCQRFLPVYSHRPRGLTDRSAGQLKIVGSGVTAYREQIKSDRSKCNAAAKFGMSPAQTHLATYLPRQRMKRLLEGTYLYSLTQDGTLLNRIRISKDCGKRE